MAEHTGCCHISNIVIAHSIPQHTLWESLTYGLHLPFEILLLLLQSHSFEQGHWKIPNFKYKTITNYRLNLGIHICNLLTNGNWHDLMSTDLREKGKQQHIWIKLWYWFFWTQPHIYFLSIISAEDMTLAFKGNIWCCPYWTHLTENISEKYCVAFKILIIFPLIFFFP